MKPALSGMAKRKSGRIVFVASTAGLKGYPYVAPYVGQARRRRVDARTGDRDREVWRDRERHLPGLRRVGHADRESVQRIVRTTGRTVAEARASLSAQPTRKAASSSRRKSPPPSCGCVARRQARSPARRFRFREARRGERPSSRLQPAATAWDRLRLWLRLLRASRTIEAELRERLKRDYDTTLPRFDVMAALYRSPEGMLMSDLSRYLLVSNGNVTGIVDRLVSGAWCCARGRNGDRHLDRAR